MLFYLFGSIYLSSIFCRAFFDVDEREDRMAMSSASPLSSPSSGSSLFLRFNRGDRLGVTGVGHVLGLDFFLSSFFSRSIVGGGVGNLFFFAPFFVVVSLESASPSVLHFVSWHSFLSLASFFTFSSTTTSEFFFAASSSLTAEPACFSSFES